MTDDEKWVQALAVGFYRAGAMRAPLTPDPDVIAACVRTAAGSPDLAEEARQKHVKEAIKSILLREDPHQNAADIKESTIEGLTSADLSRLAAILKHMKTCPAVRSNLEAGRRLQECADCDRLQETFIRGSRE